MSSSDTGGAVLRGGPAFVIPDTGRILGLDAARGLAILGMLAAHTLHSEGDAFYDGRSSIVFAVLAGISLGLMTGGARGLPREKRPRARLSIAIRALLLIALGLSLWLLDTNVAIILDSYGFLFLICLPLLFVNRWVLVGLAVACAVVGPLVILAVVAATDPAGAIPVSSDDIAAVPLGWLAGYYPAPVWLGYLLAGLAIARSGITRGRTLCVMAIGGSVVAVLGYGISSALGEPVVAHTDTTAEAVSSGALAIALTGLLVAAFGYARGRAVTLALHPLTSAGAMPLSIYTAQILVLALLAQRRESGGDYSPDETTVLFGSLAIGSLAFGALWSIRFDQGPLEWLFARVTLRRPWRSRPEASTRG